MGLLFRSRDASTWHGFHLAEPYALIGTSLPCNVRIPDERIEPCHAYLQSHDGRLLVCDLTGLGGVKQDGRPITAQWFAPDAEFEIGPYQVRVAAIEDDRRDSPAGAAAFATIERAHLEITLACGPQPHRRTRSTDDVILIGQAPECDFVVDESGVAPFHCSLVQTAEAVWVVDLGAGTALNGEMISQAMLAGEAQLRIGSHELRITWSGQNSDRAPRAADPSYTMIPARTKNIPPVSSLVNAGSRSDGHDELVRTLVEDLEESHRQAFDEARRMVRDVLISHERMHREQIDAMQRQHDHLMEIINNLISSRGGAWPAADQPRLPQPMPAASLETSAAGPGCDQFDLSLSLETDPAMKDAWLRGQLQAIDESLKNSQARGLKKFLRGRRPREEQAFH
jgi:hypothetical protein